MADSSVSRRRCLDLGVAGALAGGFAMAAPAATNNNEPRLPREVWIAAMSRLGLQAETPQEMCGKMLARMAESLPLQPDIICTPEVFAFSGLTGHKPRVRDVAEERSGPILYQFADFARRHRCYVICSTYTKEAGRCYISSVLLDRRGQYLGEYRKAHPTDSELDLGVTPGPLKPPLFQTDFGKIGIQICYDVNWFQPWDELSRAGVDVVFWPSAFGGGMMLNSLARMNKYYIISSTCEHPTKIVSPLGEDIVETGRAANWVFAQINLDVAVVQTVDHIRKFDQITAKYGRRFRFRILHTEALATIEGTSSEISVSEVLHEFGILTSRELIVNSTRSQSARRPA
ncbi:MAG TPA: carbon-nitrogen hydrolase family protein [Bryobacteraceae bacterium]|nr:carbon-nitrogen hydrolase family protein [Bryobacteraceae bacterium]